MCELFGAGRNVEYSERLKRLTDNGIALWDVAHRCKRHGSLDADIDMKSVCPNDFKKFFATHPNIHTVLFNGQKAEQLFKRLVIKTLPGIEAKAQLVRLPSTSPANASLSKDQKTELWRKHLSARPLCP